MYVDDLDTPVLLVDRSRLDANIREMAGLAAGHGKRLRPHIKTHKCVEIMKLQLAAGAVGIAAAKVSEAVVMVNGGARDVFIANQIIGEAKARQLAALATRAVVSVGVDTSEGVGFAARAAQEQGVSLTLVIEVDTRLGRAGVRTATEAAELARSINAEPNLRVGGVFTHEGHLYRAMTSDQRRRAADAAAEVIRRVGAVVADVVGSPITISVGSTPGAELMAEQAGITEMRPGVYVFSDRMQQRLGRNPGSCALSVLATVTSVTSDGKCVVDAGVKSLASDRLVDDASYGDILDRPNWQFVMASEEHGIILHHGEQVPRPGDKIRIVPNHACTCVNMHSYLHIVENNEVVDRWCVDARGRIF